jgi:uncharacterized membrane protein SirB2
MINLVFACFGVALFVYGLLTIEYCYHNRLYKKHFREVCGLFGTILMVWGILILIMIALTPELYAV